MTTQTHDTLEAYCLRIRNHDPALWEAFVACFDIYSTEVTVAVTEAPQDMILNMQGRAQQCRALLRMFKECGHKRPTPTPPAPAA